MELENLKSQIENLEKERSVILKELRKVEKSNSIIYNKLTKLKEQRDTIELSNVTLENVDWEFMLNDAHNASTIKYNKLNAIFQEIKKKYNLKYNGIDNFGAWTDTNQRSIKFGLIYNNNEYTQNIILILKQLLPYIIPLKDGYKHFEIFTNDSCTDSFNLLVTKDGQAKIWTSANYRNHEYNLDTLENTMKYIQDYLWYEGGPNEDDYED